MSGSGQESVRLDHLCCGLCVSYDLLNCELMLLNNGCFSQLAPRMAEILAVGSLKGKELASGCPWPT